ncbi:MAG: hypothetical protein CR217_07980 [Beijerinckiaceae bacterium]|nr:MAG: hypothetical protein CR217_07980 [Beijerinckiaceae bacterium]
MVECTRSAARATSSCGLFSRLARSRAASLKIAERGKEPPMFANLVEEAGKMGGYVLECFVVPQTHCYTATAFDVFGKLSVLALS